MLSESRCVSGDYKKMSSVICKVVGQLLVKSKQPDKTYSVCEAQKLIARVLKALPVCIPDTCSFDAIGNKSYYNICASNQHYSSICHLLSHLCKKLRVIFPYLFFHFTSNYEDDDDCILMERILIDNNEINIVR